MKLTAFGLHLQSFTMTFNINGEKMQLNQVREWLYGQILREQQDRVNQMHQLDLQDEQLSMEDVDRLERMQDLQRRILEEEDYYGPQVDDQAIYLKWDLWEGQWRDLVTRLRRRNVYVGI